MPSDLYYRNARRIARQAPGERARPYTVYRGTRPAYAKRAGSVRKPSPWPAFWFYAGVLVTFALIGILSGITAQAGGLR